MPPLPPPIVNGQPLTALAPMQDVTDLPFMRVIGHYGPPDYFFTEYFRVHECSRLEPHILQSITENETGRPVFAQLIGEDIAEMRRTVRDLLHYPVAGIDLNMGCPAPKVYRKNVGGGLLRDPAKIDQLLGALRDAIPGLFTVKMRIGFDSDEHFAAVLDLINKHNVDLLSLHGRTVKGMYRSAVDYDRIRDAAAHVRCPVLANGDVSSAAKAGIVLAHTGAAGVMIGRGAIRNPWMFRQCREACAGLPVFAPTFADVYDYIERLWISTGRPGLPEHNHLNRMKKFLNFVGLGVDPEGQFLYRMRRTRSPDDLFAVCREFLIDAGRAALPFATEPHPGLAARPNHETECGLSA